jgi:hypothetical protein
VQRVAFGIAGRRGGIVIVQVSSLSYLHVVSDFAPNFILRSETIS